MKGIQYILPSRSHLFQIYLFGIHTLRFYTYYALIEELRPEAIPII